MSISRWVLDLLLSDNDKERIAKQVLVVSPLPDHVWRSQKTHLLSTIESEIVEASVSETILESLEAIEDLDRGQGIQVTDSMTAAYCDVATELTVNFLACSEGKPNSKYKETVDRVCKGRVRVLESEGCKLVSAELKDRMDEIEAAVSDLEVSEKLARLNTRYESYDAVRSVKAYVKEALAMRDPPTNWGVCYTMEGDQLVVMGIHGAELEEQKADETNELDSQRVNHDAQPPVDNERNSETPTSVALSRKHEKDHIRDAEDVGIESSTGQSSAKITKVQTEWKSDVIALRLEVTDPLPDALCKSEEVISELERKENDPRSLSVDKGKGLENAQTGNIRNLPCSYQNNVARQGSYNRRRVIKRWSVQGEDTLFLKKRKRKKENIC